MKKLILILLITCSFCGLLLCGFAYFSFFRSNTTNNQSVIVTVPYKASYAQLIDSLQAKQLLRSEKTFRWTTKIMRYKTIRHGHYSVDPHLSNMSLIRLLRAGQHYPVSFSFNNVRVIEQFVQKVGHQFFFEPEELQRLLQDSLFLSQYGFTTATLPALFIPDRYEIYYDITAEKFIEKMVYYYHQFWNDERKAKAQEIGLSPVEVATLASIVEEENYRPEEKAIIAGLYMNRLHKGMLLQADPTVKFAIGDFARKRILNVDLQVDSPYNTYKYQGLPPGPIRIPEASTMDSVLHYAKHDYLFMCAKEDLSGYHNFTKSAVVHAQNAARYRAALNKQQIKR